MNVESKEDEVPSVSPRALPRPEFKKTRRNQQRRTEGRLLGRRRTRREIGVSETRKIKK